MAETEGLQKGDDASRILGMAEYEDVDVAPIRRIAVRAYG